MDASDINTNAKFTCQGEGEWRVRAFCMTPTVDMYNEKTGELVSFGMGGTRARDFRRISETGFEERCKLCIWMNDETGKCENPKTPHGHVSKTAHRMAHPEAGPAIKDDDCIGMEKRP